MRRFFVWLSRWGARGRFDRELIEEIETHRSLRRDQFEQSGLSVPDADAASRRALGNTTLAMEEARAASSWTPWDGFIRDLRVTMRGLRRTPGFTIAVVSSLALGVALVGTTIASVDAYLVRSLPYPASERLYRVVYAPPGQAEPRGLTDLDWSPLNDLVEIADSSSRTRFTLTDGAYRLEVIGLMVAPGSLEALGVRAVLGRTLLGEDFRTGAESVALIGQTLWRERFGSNPNLHELHFQANNANQNAAAETYRIVGVMPPGFRFVRDYAVGDAEIVVPQRTPFRVYMVRLREGVSPAVAESRITAAARSLVPTLDPTWRVRLASVREDYAADIRPILVAVTAAAGLVLVIVCANVAILVLLRALRRQKEVAVRLALGAGRRHIARSLIVEPCLLTVAGFAAGLALTMLTLRLMATTIQEQLGRDVPGGTSSLSVDMTVLLTLAGVGLLVALGLSLMPLLAPWQRRPADTMRREGRSGTDGPRMQWARGALVSLEVAGSLALLVGCGLMVQTVINLAGTDLGQRTAHIVRTRVTLPASTYTDSLAMARFYDALNERLSTAPGSSIALANFPPLVEPSPQPFEADAAVGGPMSAGVLAASAGYFDMLGIDLRQGRSFTTNDRIGSQPVAIVSNSLARRLWPDQSAIGHRVRTAVSPVAGAPLGDWRTIVGVSQDVRQSWTDADLDDIYIPYFQAPTLYGQLLLRVDRPDSAWLGALRTTVASLDSTVLIPPPVSLEASAARQLAGPRFLAAVMTGFAVFAVFLALLGIYGVTAYTVQQRQSEIAIRMALGASGRAIALMFTRRAAVVLVIGLIAGLFGAHLVARLLEHRLHGVPAFDAATLAVTCVLMGLGAMVATWFPAKRAAAQSPFVALKKG